MAQSGKKPSANDGGTWKENLGKYFIDLSKYVATGVVITSIFSDLADKAMIYLSGVLFAVTALIVGLILANKKKGE
ncbi:MAG: hypothetical protein IJT19_05385 [Bacteroidaceae bacterium]|nr:hypothetical protein [Bacteroidaceae bacterium]